MSAGQTYYFNNSQNSDVSPYKVLDIYPSGAAEQIVTKTLTGSQTGVLVQQFLTPQLGFPVIPGGTQRFYLHFLKPASNDNIEAYVTIQLANSSGTGYGTVIQSGKELIGWVNSTDPAEVKCEITLPSTGINVTDRIIVKIYLDNIEIGRAHV